MGIVWEAYRKGSHYWESLESSLIMGLQPFTGDVRLGNPTPLYVQLRKNNIHPWYGWIASSIHPFMKASLDSKADHSEHRYNF